MQRFIFHAVLMIPLLMVSSKGIAAQESKKDQVSAAGQTDTLPKWNLADLIPKVAELSIRFSDLNRKLSADKDLSAIDQRLSEFDTELTKSAARLKSLKDSSQNVYAQLLQLNRTLDLQRQQLGKVAKPVNDDIRQLWHLHNKWVHESERWKTVEKELRAETRLDGINSILTNGQAIISKALGLIRQSLQPKLSLQGKVAQIHVRIVNLAAETTVQIQATLSSSVQADTYPPIVSDDFMAQIKITWHPQMIDDLLRVPPGDRLFFIEQRGFVLFQVGLTLVLIIFIYRNRKTLAAIKRLQFIASRPISAGLFFTLGPFFRFHSLGPAQWRALLIAIVLISLLRLGNQLFEKTWKQRALYYLAFIIISENVLVSLGASIPVMRIYVFLTAAAGIYFFLCWAKTARVQGDGIRFVVGLRLAAFCLAIVVVGELLGKSMPAKYLFLAARAIALTIGWWLMMRCAGGGLEWIVHRSNWPLPSFVRQNPDTALGRATFLVNVLLSVLYLSTLLVALEVYQDPVTAIKGLLAMGVNLGEQRITIGLALEAGALALGAYISAQVFQGLFLTKLYELRQVDPGVRFSINHLVTYAFVFAGFLLALAVLGFRLNQLTIMISAIGVGAGFGLKEIVNNLIGGLILLFERPVRVGDAIEMEGQWAEVKEIGLRATRVRTYDNADVIVPNSDLTTNRVTNWTLSSRMMRIRIPVGDQDIEGMCQRPQRSGPQTRTQGSVFEFRRQHPRFRAPCLDIGL